MPGPDDSFLVRPSLPSITVSLEPALNAVHSILLVCKADSHSGLGDWIYRTAKALSQRKRRRLRLVMIGLHYAIEPEASYPSFPAFVDHLATRDPRYLREKLLRAYAGIVACDKEETSTPLDYESIDWNSVLANVDNYLAFLDSQFTGCHIDRELEAQAYSYVIDPPAMQDLIVSQLREMWQDYLQPEWTRVEPILLDAVRAFKQIDFSEMDRIEALRLVTGQDLAANMSTQKIQWINSAERLIFIPSTHIGPYLGTYHDESAFKIIFGARLPEGVLFDAPHLSRNEIVVRLNALADDTRLQILKLTLEQGEQRSQDIMEVLDLSQSAASRHLKQLSATGYLIERRCQGAKCYKLNEERIKDTLKAVENFLVGKL
ncbi:MAG: winged helix-turn-helix transcriptional regulator [Anaerolineales bacterium]|nr:winged helix-turn-helix transcriptional regulator [Anaerolineales bacterium]